MNPVCVGVRHGIGKTEIIETNFNPGCRRGAGSDRRWTEN
jgi:hypothetical protein